jgi:uncharacterized SAM-binding protein YcdF (DUF218 family)
MTVTDDDLAADTDGRPPRRRPASPWRIRFRRFAVGALVLGVLVFAYVSVTFVQVWQASRRDDHHASQAIIVLGAAQFDGRPSGVLAARLDHAVDLYEAGAAPLVVVTGGRQPGDRFTEAEASAGYLEAKGVPGDAIERETTSTNSWDELTATARFLRGRGITEVILVSDPFHSYRIAAMATDLGLTAHVSPTTTSPLKGADELRAMLRETGAVSLGRIIGFDRLVRWEDHFPF